MVNGRRPAVSFVTSTRFLCDALYDHGDIPDDVSLLICDFVGTHASLEHTVNNREFFRYVTKFFLVIPVFQTVCALGAVFLQWLMQNTITSYVVGIVPIAYVVGAYLVGRFPSNFPRRSLVVGMWLFPSILVIVSAASFEADSPNAVLFLLFQTMVMWVAFILFVAPLRSRLGNVELRVGGPRGDLRIGPEELSQFRICNTITSVMCNAEPNRFDHDLIADEISSITRFRYAPHNAPLVYLRFIAQKVRAGFRQLSRSRARGDFESPESLNSSESSLAVEVAPSEVVFYDVVRINMDVTARAKVAALASIYVELSTDLLRHLQRLRGVKHLRKNIAVLSNPDKVFPVIRRLHFCTRLKMIRENRRNRRSTAVV